MPPSDNNFSLGHLLKMEKESGRRERDRKWRARTFSMNSITEVARLLSESERWSDRCQSPKLPH